MKREIVDSMKMLLGNEDRINDNTALLHWACNSLLEHDSNAKCVEGKNQMSFLVGRTT